MLLKLLLIQYKIIKTDHKLSARSLAQSNRLDDSAFDSSIQATKVIDKNSLKTFSISKLARSLAQSNRLDEATKIGNGIKYDDSCSCRYTLVLLIFIYNLI